MTINTPKYLKLDRATERDLEAHEELARVLWASGRQWMFSPPVGSCGERGLALAATSSPGVYAIVPINYSRDSAAEKRLSAAQEALTSAGYKVTRSGWWVLVRSKVTVLVRTRKTA